MNNGHVLPVRVYYEDTDAAGIVYHARYLHFAERGRTEMLRELGFDHLGLKEELDLVFAVQRCDILFKRPAKLDDLLSVVTTVTGQSGARIEMIQRIRRGDVLLCEIKVILAVLSHSLRPRRLPGSIVTAFRRHMVE